MEEDPCARKPGAIIVLTKAEKLYLCGSKASEGSYEVSIGKNGPGKHRTGDKKTPIGRYAIGEPRTSGKFHIFIPIGYPTEGQKKLGFSGGEIGIHGPWIPFKRLGDMDTLIDWTTGCIAVGTDREIERISEWVRDNSPEFIYIK